MGLAATPLYVLFFLVYISSFCIQERRNYDITRIYSMLSRAACISNDTLLLGKAAKALGLRYVFC